MGLNVDVIVVGGGIVGLSTAWRLSQTGLSVAVVEKSRPGSEASSAAAGMLAPYAEATNRGPFSELGRASLERYAGFVDELKRETTLDPELIRTGLLRVAEGVEGEATLRETYAAMLEMGSRAEWIGDKALHEVEPALSPDVTAAIYSPTEWQVDPRRLIQALAVAVAANGGAILERTEVTGFTLAGSRVTGVRTTTGEILCDRVLLAGGSWNAGLLALLGVEIGVRPVRGQIACVGPLYPMPLRHTVYSHNGYLVPRSNGRVLVGSTEDEAGFDSRPSAGGIAGILGRGVALAPMLSSAPVESVWAGLRPLSPDRMPVLGRVGQWPNAFVAAGHFRNGILLAPITSELMTTLITTGQAPIDPAFSPARFSQP
ncbi:MAG: glycine oxidase ThiO [Capsulimonadaceae bacterium]|nr:glycine oxidase ThiO [Capsulimonadaceae bacterium]